MLTTKYFCMLLNCDQSGTPKERERMNLEAQCTACERVAKS